MAEIIVVVLLNHSVKRTLCEEGVGGIKLVKLLTSLNNL